MIGVWVDEFYETISAAYFSCETSPVTRCVGSTQGSTVIASVTVEDFGTACEVTSDFHSVFVRICTSVGEQYSLEVISTSDVNDLFSQCGFSFCGVAWSCEAQFVCLSFDSVYDFWQAVT